MLNFQEELSVSGSGTVVIRSPRGSQASTQFHSESSPVDILNIMMLLIVLSFAMPICL